MKLSRYLKIYPCVDEPGQLLLYSTKRSALVRLPESTLRAAVDGTLSDGDQAALARLGFLVADPEAERNELRNTFLNTNKQHREFNAVVVLNLDCNLACGYCYEDNFRGGFYLTRETASLLVDRLVTEQIDEGRDLQITFYGGEPLLSLDLLKEIAGRLKDAADRRGTKSTFSLITNGTLLTARVARELIPLGLTGAKITLDGPRENHDLSRPFASGSGSFDTIVDNVVQLCGLIKLNLGGNFTRNNYRSFPSLLDLLLSRGVTPDQVAKVQFAPVVRKSGETGVGDFGGECVCSHEPWMVEAALYLREETLKRGFRPPKVQMSACPVEYQNNVVVNYDGSLYKCPAFMSEKSLCIGTLQDGIHDYRLSHNLDVWKTDECLDCAYLPICFGGCRQLTLLRTGAIGEVDCRKDFYDATLGAILRQDLAYPLKAEIKPAQP